MYLIKNKKQLWIRENIWKKKITRIRNSMDRQIEEKGFATVADTFIDNVILEKLHYEKWRKGQVLYLEKVCKVNLNKLSEIIKEIYKYSKELDLKESFTFYKNNRKRNRKS